MIKKLISILCVISLSLGLVNFSSVFAADTVLSAVSAYNTYKVGDTVTVEFNLSDNPGFASLQFDIAYDTNILKYVSNEIGSVKGDYADITDYETYLTYGTLAFMDNIKTNGTVATITFEAIGEGSTTIEINNLDFVAIDDSAEFGQAALNISGKSISISVNKDISTTEATTKAPVTQATTEKSTETTTKAATTQTTTEKATETTTIAKVTTTEKATESTTNSTETTTIARRTGGGSSRVASVKTTTTENTTETVTEESSEETTEAVISKDVKVTIGAKKVIIGDKTYDMDVAPYIQTTSNSTLVPLRFVALAICGEDVEKADTSKLIAWDATTKTATISAGNKVIKFTAGSNTMIVNGKSQTMDNGVKAEINNGRMFVPFRALGNALGVNVNWDADTRTATYSID